MIDGLKDEQGNERLVDEQASASLSPAVKAGISDSLLRTMANHRPPRHVRGYMLGNTGPVRRDQQHLSFGKYEAL